MTTLAPDSILSEIFAHPSRLVLTECQERAPLCVAYGMGVDSTALLVGLHLLGIRPDLITFADVGGELPETYAYLETINAWCRRVGFPEVVVVRYDGGMHKRYFTLEGNCLANGVLPGLAVGNKSCSIKFKLEVQNKYRYGWQPARDAWKRILGHKMVLIEKGKKAGQYRRVDVVQLVTVLIGYDAGPKDARRSTIADDDRFHYEYPLRLWGWDRDECKRRILAAGLPVPHKSSCFFCPSMKPAELVDITLRYPDLADRIIAIEAAAVPADSARRAAGKTASYGLWRTGTKGMRGAIAKPASMTTLIREIRGLPTDPSIPLPPGQSPDRKYLPMLALETRDDCDGGGCS